MWRELWLKHRTGFCFAFGMVCFLTAGLLVRALPSYKDKLLQAESTAFPRPASSRSQSQPQSQPQPLKAAAQEKQEEEVVKTTVRRSAGTTSGVSVLSVQGDLAENNANGEWFLYITGSVRKPGVYRLPVGARLFQLVEAAGGLNNFADPVAINMASLLEDGLHIHIPRRGERPNQESTFIVEPVVVPTAPVRPRSSIPRSGLVDINRATEKELTALKGVGPALAKNVVEYRQKNGRFRNIEDLLQVKGIGDKKLEGFRKNVTVAP